MASSSSRGQRDGRHVRMDTTGAGTLGDLILRACHGRVSFLPATLVLGRPVTYTRVNESTKHTFEVFIDAF